MLNDYWKHFKSGTDIRAVAMDGASYTVREVNAFPPTICANMPRICDAPITEYETP